MINSRNIDDLKPEVKDRANAFISKAKAAGIDLIITSTYRDYEAQNALYAKGRSTTGRIVTNAKGGYSYHNFRCAVDVVPIKHGKCVWGTEGEDLVLWKEVGRIGESCGLEWAGRWSGRNKEFPHFQYSGGMNLEQLRKTHKES